MPAAIQRDRWDTNDTQQQAWNSESGHEAKTQSRQEDSIALAIS
jgi:hypothetical protein